MLSDPKNQYSSVYRSVCDSVWNIVHSSVYLSVEDSVYRSVRNLVDSKLYEYKF
jgi:hypothetical protein